MKKVLLIVLGLAFISMEGIAQKGRGHGNGQGKGKGKKSEYVVRGNNGNAYGHQKNRKSKGSNHHNNNTTVVVRGGSSVAYARPRYESRDYRHRHGSVYVSYRPGIRYVRHYTIRPLTYIYVYDHGIRYRRSIISMEQVDAIADKMAYTRGDARRLQVAKDMLWNKMLYAEDVAYLMTLLNDDEHRLNLARFAFSRTVDKENYDFVREEIILNEHKRALDRFIY